VNLTQLLSIEITPLCNRGSEHKACPNRHPDRWMHSAGLRPMSDHQIVSLVVEAHRMGFSGCVAWHVYNEPLMDWPRIQNVTKEIRLALPECKFLLWTNGDLMPDDASAFVGVFQTIVITNYANRDFGFLSSACDDIRFVGPGLDWRLNPPHNNSDAPCYRPFLECQIDYFGNVRVCCNAWRGEVSVGNIHDTAFADLWSLWVAQRSAIAATPMSASAPQRCRFCGTRYTSMADYAHDAAARIKSHLGIT
jgi:hypothetical protein